MYTNSGRRCENIFCIIVTLYLICGLILTGIRKKSIYPGIVTLAGDIYTLAKRKIVQILQLHQSTNLNICPGPDSWFEII